MFDDDFVYPQCPQLIILRSVKEWMDANVNGSRKDIVYMPVKWVPPSEGWVKVNVDGSRDTGLGNITAGGMIRNHLKEWLSGFVLNKGASSALEAEF